MIFTIFLFYNCEDTEFNTPSVQANKNNNFWRANAFSASINEAGFLTISAQNSTDEIFLTVPNASIGEYVFGEISGRDARVVTFEGEEFSTNNRPDESVSLYPELGFLKIDEIVNNTFTGTFEFLAFDESGEEIIGFNEGIFFQVPLLSGIISAEMTTCADTNGPVVSARNAFQATFSEEVQYINSDEYTSACQAYRAALENQFLYCGDEDGSIQEEIESLNECVFPCEFAEQNRTTAEEAFNNPTIGNYIAGCENYKFYLEQQLEICGDDFQNSIQTAIDTLNCADTDNDGIADRFEDLDEDGDLMNDDTDEDGTPNFMDNDDDGDGILTQFESQDEDGNPTDTDNDLTDDYLDNDDDGDGTPTAEENADPNMDGNPDDAVDTDEDGTPDYLDSDS